MRSRATDLPSVFHLASQSTPLPGQGSSQAMATGQGRFLYLRPLTLVVSALTASGFWKKRLKVQAGHVVGFMVLLLLLVEMRLPEKSVMPVQLKMSL